MLKRVVVGVAVILVGAAMLAPSKVLAAKKKIIPNKAYCECQCYVRTDEGTTITKKKFTPLGGANCSAYNEIKCRTKKGDGKLFDCEEIVERAGSRRVAPGLQPLAPVAPKSVAPKSVAPSDQPLAPVQ